MLKFVVFACLCACSLAQTISFCGGDAVTVDPKDISLTNANPIKLMTQAFQVTAKGTITKALTIDQLNSAKLVIDAYVTLLGSDHICKNGNFIGSDGLCTLNFCSTIGADLCTQIAQGPQVLSIANQSFGPVDSTTLPSWLSSVFGMLPNPDKITIKASVVLGTETLACLQIANLEVDFKK